MVNNLVNNLVNNDVIPNAKHIFWYASQRAKNGRFGKYFKHFTSKVIQPKNLEYNS